jgi:hypothetical protein
MNKPEWTPEHAALLESLRIKAGMDLATLARRNMLSTLQVKQLEKGGDSGFYSSAIKFSTGQKLLKFFGHSLKPASSIAPTPSHSPSPSPSPSPLPNVQVEPSDAPPNLLKTTALKPIEQTDQPHQAPTSNSKPYWLGLAFILMAILALAIFQIDDTANPSVKTNPTFEIKVTPPNAEKLSTPQVDVVAAPTTESEKPSMRAAATLEKSEAPELLSGTCKWGSSEIEIQAAFPRKRGEYVHVVALENATVCIQDGEQRVASLSLVSGQARSIYGPPPFRVYSPNFALVRLYFQGQYIKLPSEDTRQIKLSPVALP